MKLFTPELINSLTPIWIALMGGLIGLTVIIVTPFAENKDIVSPAMGVAGTAFAGAAGLAQSNKNEPNSNTDTQNPQV